ncbi:uncharacterized protein BO97DRAFT_412929 [Aspergillus homomorphus CBS 101889]|uniref:F-box domain-containing protein n=1 Tax=Aspergillus homomorphus (strain CBS 101889) TaxID=1450537 RepID=A0A395I1U3_ASPHC|nr:hypothetical protein BO97DRAFT_412929 [Aspergillus homomorphus CBS 101889]RAL14162.1 hypothetical protein BO97DRAFT_412929 [Aspergillus homomorphus CBS 101889]
MSKLAAESQGRSRLLQLPDELHLEYLQYLDVPSLNHLSQTCVTLHVKLVEELIARCKDYAVGSKEGYEAAIRGELERILVRQSHRSGRPGGIMPQVDGHRLLNAVLADRFDAVLGFLKAGADPNRPCYAKWPLLHHAVLRFRSGRTPLRMIQIFLEHGAPPNDQVMFLRSTALDLLLYRLDRGRFISKEAIQLLLSYRASPTNQFSLAGPLAQWEY